jgi:hypothetical protein
MASVTFGLDRAYPSGLIFLAAGGRKKKVTVPLGDDRRAVDPIAR